MANLRDAGKVRQGRWIGTRHFVRWHSSCLDADCVVGIGGAANYVYARSMPNRELDMVALLAGAVLVAWLLMGFARGRR